jgi:hypothetical protein
MPANQWIANVHADLVSQGCTVLFPATEHAPFDLVAYAAGEFHRLQVKYRSARAGAVKVQFRSMWADRTLELCAERGAWRGPTPSREPNFGMKGGAPQERFHARYSYPKPRRYTATCRQVAD